MSHYSRISDWKNKDAHSINADEFFLKESENPQLYHQAKEAYASRKVRFEPVEQLSPKGLALLSAYFADKEGSEAQPVIASSSEDLEYILLLIGEAPIGTQISIIFQMTDADELGPYYQDFGSGHKTVLKLEKQEDTVQIVHMDSTNNRTYGNICYSLIQEVYGESEQPFVYYQQAQIENTHKNDGSTFSRQVDEYQCGTFSVKDARALGRERSFLETVETEHVPPIRRRNGRLTGPSNRYTYELPATSFKSIQHRRFAESALEQYGDRVVTSRERTLQETHEKHGDSGYIQHFSEKYNQIVSRRLSEHENSPEVIYADVERYDAANMTVERLAEVYGPTDVQQKYLDVQRKMKETLKDTREDDETNTPEEDNTSGPRPH